MFPHFRRRFDVLCWFLLGALAISAGGSLQGEESPVPKDHVVFVGLTLTTQSGAGEGRIVSVTRGSVEVVENGQTVTMPLGAVRDVQTGREPVVSAASVTISRDVGTRVYAGVNDPARQALQDQVVMDSLQDQQTDRMVQTQVGALSLAEAAARVSDPRIRGAVAEEAGKAIAKAEGATQLALVNRDLGQKAQLGRDGQDRGFFDAFEVTFEIASPETIDNAHGVLLTTIRDPNNPRVAVDFIHLQKLPKIDANPRKIRLKQTGLPIGFGVDGYRIHVYANGRELASNLSEKRVELTRDEAFQFLSLQYTMARGRETHPPVLVPELLPTNGREQFSGPELGTTVEVSVDREGNVVDVALDRTDARAAARIEAFVRKARFFPALVAGELTAGTAVLLLSDFVR